MHRLRFIFFTSSAIFLSFCILLNHDVRMTIIYWCSSPLRPMIQFQQQSIFLLQSSCAVNKDLEYDLPDLSSADDLILSHNHNHLAFLLETSGRSHLSVRQACAVESAARHSGRNVLLLMVTQRIKVCPMMDMLLNSDNLLLLSLNTSLLVRNTPVEAIWDDRRINSTCCKTIHLSDIYRMVVLYRFLWESST